MPKRARGAGVKTKRVAKGDKVEPGTDELIEAAQNNDLEEVRRLIAEGVDVNGIDYLDWGALHYAAMYQWKEVALALLGAGADPNGKATDTTPLILAVRSDDMVDVVRKLIAAGADLRRTDDDGMTALDAAEAYDNPKCIRALRRAGAKRAEAAPQKPFVMPDIMAEEGDEVEAPNFAMRMRPKGFDRVVARVAAALKRQTNTSRIRGAACFESTVRAAVSVVKREQASALKQGVYIVRLEGWAPGWGRNERTVVAVLPTTAWTEIVALAGTRGPNYDVTTSGVIRALKRIEKTNPFVLTAVADDVVEARFGAAVNNPPALARAVAALAPDVVSQGAGTVDRLAEEIAGSRELFLWWD